MLLAAAAGGGLLASLGAWRLWSKPRALPFPAGGWVLLADVENSSGDSLFDRALHAGLDVALSQSRHLNLLPAQRLSRSLRRMGQAPVDKLTRSIAIDLARKEGASWVIAPTLERRGSGHRIAAELVDPHTQRSVRSLHADAELPAGLPQAIDSLAQQIRRLLGEPAAEIAARSVPLAQAATASLEALDRYALSQRAMADDTGKAAALLREAIERDADFALAIGRLGQLRFERGTRESRTEGDALLNRALSLPQRLSSRERMWLHAAADDHRGNRETAVAGYRAFLAQHPLDTTAWFRLGWLLMAVFRRLEEAIEAFGRVTAIDANNVSAWVNLATCQSGLGRRDEALAAYQKAFAVDPAQRLGLYVNGEYGALLVRLGRIDDARANFADMARHDDPQRAARGLRSLAYLAMHQGRYRQAIGELERAMAINQKAGFGISAFRDRLLVAAAHLALGEPAQARRALEATDAAIQALSPAAEWLAKVARLRAQLGDFRAAETVIARMATMVGVVGTGSSVAHNTSDDLRYLDLARGELALARGQPTESLSHLTAAATGLTQRAVLGPLARALSASGRLDAAAETYRQLLASAPFGIERQEDAEAAVLGLAAIYETQGRRADAKALYEQLVVRWKAGDPELLLLKQARTRLQALN